MAYKGFDRVRRLSRALAIGAGLASARFPVAALCIASIAVLTNLSIADIDMVAPADLPRIFAALYGAMAGSIVVRLIAESRGLDKVAAFLGPLSAAILVAVQIWNAPLLTGTAPLVTALTLAIPLAPFIGRPDDGSFWSFTLWTFVGVVLAFLSVLFFVLGLSVILEMIRFLFGIGLGQQAYEHIYGNALTLVGPLFALGRIPTRFDDEVQLAGDDRLAAGVRVFIDWVAVPLALATALVLHLYAAKIMVLATLPKNEIGWIVTFFASVVLTLRIAMQPFLQDGAAPTRLFAKLWAPMLVVPLALLVLAAWLRVGAEGFTVERYYLTLGAAVSVLCVIFQLVPRLRGNIRLLACLPLLALALSSIGPLGIAQTVARSQIAHLKIDLADRLAADGTIRLSELEDDDRAVLRSRYTALSSVDSGEALLPLLPENRGAQAREAMASGGDLFAALGLVEHPSLPDALEFTAAKPSLFDIAGFDLITPEISASLGITENDSGLSTADIPQVALDPGGLVVQFRGHTAHFPLAEAIRAIPEATFLPLGADPSQLAPPIFDLRDEAGRTLRLRVSRLVIDRATRKARYAAFTAALKTLDWR